MLREIQKQIPQEVLKEEVQLASQEHPLISHCLSTPTLKPFQNLLGFLPAVETECRSPWKACLYLLGSYWSLDINCLVGPPRFKHDYLQIWFSWVQTLGESVGRACEVSPTGVRHIQWASITSKGRGNGITIKWVCYWAGAGSSTFRDYIRTPSKVLIKIRRQRSNAGNVSWQLLLPQRWEGTHFLLLLSVLELTRF